VKQPKIGQIWYDKHNEFFYIIKQVELDMQCCYAVCLNTSRNGGYVLGKTEYFRMSGVLQDNLISNPDN
jgi:hypothetical protein